MTVAELIDKLQEFDDDLEVGFHINDQRDSRYMKVDTVRLAKPDQVPNAIEAFVCLE